MTSLDKIFQKCKEYNIYVNLDETYCVSYEEKDSRKKKGKYIGTVSSLSEINEIVECISEEGSVTINYRVDG